MYKAKEYTNKLQGRVEHNFYERACNPCESFYIQPVLDRYAEYINDIDKVHDIFKAIKTMSYTNGGRHVENLWNYNLHIFYINEQRFEYKTGVGIECKSIIKLLFDAVYCILQDAYFGTWSEDDFIINLGYDCDVKTYKKGLKAYKDCMEITKKCRKIWGDYLIYNLYDIISL